MALVDQARLHHPRLRLLQHHHLFLFVVFLHNVPRVSVKLLCRNFFVKEIFAIYTTTPSWIPLTALLLNDFPLEIISTSHSTGVSTLAARMK